MGGIRGYGRCGRCRRFFMHLAKKLSKAFFCGGALFCRVDDELLFGCARIPEDVPVEDEFTHFRMEENFCAEVLPCHIACGPPAAELPVRNGEFPTSSARAASSGFAVASRRKIATHERATAGQSANSSRIRGSVKASRTKLSSFLGSSLKFT